MTVGPLEGIRVIDQTQVMAGPFCSQLLGDMGADVIKVEPPEGDGTRRQLGTDPKSAFLVVNRNKKGMTLDLKQPEGVEVYRRLVATVPSAEDRRRLIVDLTPEGRALFEGLRARAREATERTLAPLSAAERERFLALLKRLV